MIFIDTGAFLARYVQRDQYHERAIKHWQLLGQGRHRLVTSNFVIDETITLLARRTTYQFAADRAQIFFESEALSILRPDENDERDALKLFYKYADQKVSFTDCVSCILMKKNKIHIAFSFDRHFELMGFQREG